MILATDENVELLHHLEQVSTEGMVGSLAENLVEALGKFPAGKKKVWDYFKFIFVCEDSSIRVKQENL